MKLLMLVAAACLVSSSVFATEAKKDIWPATLVRQLPQGVTLDFVKSFPIAQIGKCQLGTGESCSTVSFPSQVQKDWGCGFAPFSSDTNSERHFLDLQGRSLPVQVKAYGDSTARLRPDGSDSDFDETPARAFFIFNLADGNRSLRFDCTELPTDITVGEFQNALNGSAIFRQ